VIFHSILLRYTRIQILKWVCVLARAISHLDGKEGETYIPEETNRLEDSFISDLRCLMDLESHVYWWFISYQRCKCKVSLRCNGGNTEYLLHVDKTESIQGASV